MRFLRPSACPFTGCRRRRRPFICAAGWTTPSGSRATSCPKHIASGILALIDRLQQPGDGLCHGDIHPENVIMTADGPRLIDWTFSIRAPAALDHGFAHISLTEFALDVTDNPQRPLAVNAAAQSEYARLSGKPVAALRQAMETWLPIAIVRYFLLMGRPTSERWRRMMQRAEAALRPQD
ncbi:phosphotransferase [Bradyrhizobium iriomotense]|nr:phosphotransferase [Bradyrhizobium iriomotense]